MFKNRAVLVKLSKTNEDAVDEHQDDRPIEEKAEAILKTLEKVAVKAFFGMCIYVMLDTHRQVAVARASNPYR